MSRTAEYARWRNIHSRCQDPNNPQYLHYGGRGIKLCKRWEEFENFLADVGPRPSPRHSLDRIDNNGHYTPKNCHWATVTEQLRNRRTTRFITYRGETKTLLEWIAILGLPRERTIGRICKGKWPPALAFEAPKGTVKRYLKHF